MFHRADETFLKIATDLDAIRAGRNNIYVREVLHCLRILGENQ